MLLNNFRNRKMQTGEGDRMLTFPSQALSCSGSTGLISALSHCDSQHPGEEMVYFFDAKITVKNRINV